MHLMQPSKTTKLHIGYAPSPTEEFRESAIDLFEKQNNPMRVVPHDLSADACRKEIMADRLGVALLPQPLRLADGIEFEPLIDYPICCIVGAKHPRLACRSAITVMELESEPFLLLSRKEFNQYYEHVYNLLSPHFAPIFCENEYDGYATLLSGVRHLNGVALLLFPVSSMSDRVKVIPFDPPLARIPVGALFMSPPLETTQKFLKATKDALKALPSSDDLTRLKGRLLCR